MTEAEKILEALLDSLDWEDRIFCTGTEHERAIAAQKSETLRKFARQALDRVPRNE